MEIPRTRYLFVGGIFLLACLFVSVLCFINGEVQGGLTFLVILAFGHIATAGRGFVGLRDDLRRLWVEISGGGPGLRGERKAEEPKDEETKGEDEDPEPPVEQEEDGEAEKKP